MCQYYEYALVYLIFRTTVRSRYHYYFRDEEMKAEGGRSNCFRSHEWFMGELRCDARLILGAQCPEGLH